MAADWTPMRNDLRDDPAVVTISIALKMDPDMVVGKLLRVWAWAGEHTTTGRVAGTSLTHLDFVAGAEGFASAMKAARWLECDDDGSIVFPRFTKRNGKAAKKRLIDARRASRKRATNVASNATKLGPTEQKRREKRNTPLTPPQGGAPDSNRASRRSRPLNPSEAASAITGGQP